MTNRINIMLLLVLGAIPSPGKNPWYISDPTDVDYQNTFGRPVEYFPMLLPYADILIQTKSDFSVHEEDLVVLKLEQNQSVNGHRYQLNNIPSKEKHNISEPQKQYAWYVEDWLWLENKTDSIKNDPGIFANTLNLGLGTLAKMLNSTIQNFNFSIHIVGEHYRIVTDSM